MFPRVIVSLATLTAGAALALGQSTAVFFPLVPCRVVDTRAAAGTFGGPTMASGTTRTFPITSGSCGIPATATAFSLNVTVVPQGPLQYLTIWGTGQAQPVVSTLNAFSGQVVANAAIVPAGNGAVSVYVTNTTDVILDINGYFSVQTDATTDSTKFGVGALASDGGSYNTGIGTNALNVNTTGTANTALGSLALQSSVSGSNNTAVGGAALGLNVSGSGNVAVGSGASYFNTSGSNNVSVGQGALENSNGNFNIGVGWEAGFNITTGSNNIDIGNTGLAADNGVIRIGTAGAQTSTFIAGITGVPVTGAAVIVGANGQLGIAASSIKYKEDIRDIGDLGDALMQLRPVAFRYKPSVAGDQGPLQYGLIAEEVEKVYPELVARDIDGQVMSVQYHELPALLLNEIQRLHKLIEKQATVIDQQHKEVGDQKRAIEGRDSDINRMEKHILNLEELVKQSGGVK